MRLIVRGEEMVSSFQGAQRLKAFVDNSNLANPRARKQSVLVPVAQSRIKPDHREKIFVSVKPGSVAPSQEYLADYIVRGRCIDNALRSIQVLCGEYAKGVDMQQASDMLFTALFNGKLKFKTAIRVIDVLAGLPGNNNVGVTADHHPGFGYYAKNFRKFIALVEERKIFRHLTPEQRAELAERVPGWHKLY